MKPLKRRPLKDIRVSKDDANAVDLSSPSYLTGGQSGGTMRDVPSLGPFQVLRGRP